MMITSSAPSRSASVRLSIDASMKVAGRKIVGSISMPGRPGSSSSSASSTPRVTSSVLAQGSFSTMSMRPGPSFTTASPVSG
jgi:hypothetical protein